MQEIVQFVETDLYEAPMVVPAGAFAEQTRGGPGAELLDFHAEYWT